MAFTDVISQLNAKITASADGATPEELAYLSAAAEKIGGQASLLDIEKYSSGQLAGLEESLSDAYTKHAADLTTMRNAAEEAVTDARLKSIAAIDTHMSTNVTPVLNDIDTKAASLQTKADQAVLDIEDASKTAMDGLTGLRSRLHYLTSV